MHSSEYVVQVEDLRVAYGTFEAVRGVSFSVACGSAFGLVGPNGAGKTSTLKVLAGLMRPSGGRAMVQGHDVVRERDAVVRNIGYMADVFGVYDYLTVTEYLAFFGGMYGLEGRTLQSGIKDAIGMVALETKSDARIATLSRGMKQRLYLARALVHRPAVLILDEPASGMDPRGRDEMVRLLKTMTANGTTIMISSHILDELRDLCSVVGVMEAGKLVGVHGMQDQEVSPAALTRYLLPTPAAERERASGWLAGQPMVSEIKLASDGLWVTVSGGEDAVCELVRAAVQEGLRVMLPRASASDLKELFLRMTKGELT
ncbi:MAG: ABC transporter ATP-binding protein [Kiritimatiellia bacterium]